MWLLYIYKYLVRIQEKFLIRLKLDNLAITYDAPAKNNSRRLNFYL
jgi:hypothetical protein